MRRDRWPKARRAAGTTRRVRSTALAHLSQQLRRINPDWHARHSSSSRRFLGPRGPLDSGRGGRGGPERYGFLGPPDGFVPQGLRAPLGRGGPPGLLPHGLRASPRRGGPPGFVPHGLRGPAGGFPFGFHPPRRSSSRGRQGPRRSSSRRKSRRSPRGRSSRRRSSGRQSCRIAAGAPRLRRATPRPASSRRSGRAFGRIGSPCGGVCWPRSGSGGGSSRRCLSSQRVCRFFLNSCHFAFFASLYF